MLDPMLQALLRKPRKIQCFPCFLLENHRKIQCFLASCLKTIVKYGVAVAFRIETTSQGNPQLSQENPRTLNPALGERKTLNPAPGARKTLNPAPGERENPKPGPRGKGKP